MEEFIAFFRQVLFTYGGQQITVGQVLSVPLFVIVAILVMRWTNRWVGARLTARQTNPDVVHLVRRIIYVIAIAIIVVTVLDLINVPLTAFAFVSGAIAIGFGFGAQNIINNFISGWILMWERPIRIGDFLEVGEARGTVEAINTRSTRIRRVDGVHMLIPNSFLLENTVVNWTLVDRNMRTVVRVGVSYGSPVKDVARMIEQAVIEQETILDAPAPVVVFEDFGDNSLVFDVFFWLEATAERDVRLIRSAIRFRIYELFDENNIVIAFPQRDVHLDGELIVKSSTAQI